MTTFKFDNELAQELHREYTRDYPHLNTHIVPGKVDGSFIVTLLGTDEDIVKVEEVHSVHFVEEVGIRWESRILFHGGHYELAKDTARILMVEAFDLNYKDYSFEYSSSTPDGPMVFLGIGSVFISMKFTTYHAREEGYSHEVGKLYEPSLLAITDRNYSKEATVGLSANASPHLRAIFEPDEVTHLTPIGLRNVFGIEIKNEVTEFTNYLDMTVADTRKPLLHALSFYYGLENAVRFFYIT